MAGFNGGDLISGIIWGTIIGVGVNMLAGNLLKGLFDAFPEKSQQILNESPELRQQLQEQGIV